MKCKALAFLRRLKFFIFLHRIFRKQPKNLGHLGITKTKIQKRRAVKLRQKKAIEKALDVKDKKQKKVESNMAKKQSQQDSKSLY